MADALAPAAFDQQIMNGAGAHQPCGKLAMPRQRSGAGLIAFAKIKCETNIKTVRRSGFTQSVGPLHHQQRAFAGFVPAKINNFIGVFDPVKVGMDNRETRCFVDLHQCKSWAGNFQLRLAGQAANKRPRKGGFARAQIPRKRDQVIGTNQQDNLFGQLLRVLLMRQVHLPSGDLRFC